MCGYGWSSGGGGRRGARLWTLLWIAVPEEGDRAGGKQQGVVLNQFGVSGLSPKSPAPPGGSTGICRAGPRLRVYTYDV